MSNHILAEFDIDILKPTLLANIMLGVLITLIVCSIVALIQMIRHRKQQSYFWFWTVFTLTLIAFTYVTGAFFAHLRLQYFHSEMLTYIYQNTNMETTLNMQHTTQWEIARVSLVFDLATLFELFLFLISWCVCKRK
jgi:hypothetical protein